MDSIKQLTISMLCSNNVMSKMKRILYICGDTTLTGGIEKYNADFINAILGTGSEISVVYRKAGGWVRKVEFAIRCLWATIVFRPNHLICGHLNFSPIALLLAVFFRTGFSINLYGIEAICINDFFSKKAVKKADHLIVISEYTKQLLAEQFDIDQKKVFMLVSSVNENEFFIKSNKEALKSLIGVSGRPIILTLSRLSSDEQKGQHLVLAAMPRVLEHFPSAVYVLAGPGSDFRVDNILKKNPYLVDHVVALGKVNNDLKLNLYNMADVFILPSKNEGFAIVSIEALACGAQVIVSSGFGGKKGLRGGRLGQLIDPDNSQSIVDSLVEALKKSKDMNITKRAALRKESLTVYGYTTWCKNVATFLKGLN